MEKTDAAIQIIARVLNAEYAEHTELDQDGQAIPDLVDLKTAQAILFALGKAGIRLIEPGDVLEEDRDSDAGTVSVLLKADG